MIVRVATGLVCLPILFAVIWFGSPVLTGLVALIAVVGFWELRRLATELDIAPPLIPGIIWSAAIVVLGGGNSGYLIEVLSIGILATLSWLVITSKKRYSLSAWGISIAGPIYVSLPLSFALLIRSSEHGREWLLLVVSVTFTTDSFAYLAGRLIGKHQLVPHLSPGKTWEGAIAGLLGGVGCALGVSTILNLFVAAPFITWWQSLILGTLLGLVAQVGDLAESFLKRLAKVKEASNLVPGHGGLLDRLDSIVFTLVVMYYWIQWVK